jgi:hypothetical protein
MYPFLDVVRMSHSNGLFARGHSADREGTGMRVALGATWDPEATEEMADIILRQMR